MTYTVSSEKLNPTHSLTHSLTMIFEVDRVHTLQLKEYLNVPPLSRKMSKNTRGNLRANYREVETEIHRQIMWLC